MSHPYHYATVSEALEKLRQQGYTVDFNLEQNGIIGPSANIDPHDFEIVDVYRYEGDTDPADEATVYAIESKSGLKGVLVTGFGVSLDAFSEQVLKKLTNR